MDVGVLGRLGPVLRVLIPAVVAIDTVYSFWKVSQLYKQRLQEWEEEELQQLHVDAVRTLHHVVLKCQRQDKEFWPAVVVHAFAAPPPPATQHATGSSTQQPTQPGAGNPAGSRGGRAGSSTAGEGQQQPAQNTVSGGAPPAGVDLGGAAGALCFFAQCLGLGPHDLDLPSAAVMQLGHPPELAAAAASAVATAGGSSGACGASPATGAGTPVVKKTPQDAPSAPADTEAPTTALPIMHDPYGPSPDALAACSAQEEAASRDQQQRQQRLNWASCRSAVLAAWGWASATLRALGQPEQAMHSVRSALEEQYGRGCGLLQEGLERAATVLRGRYEASVPWPQARLTRRSALRYRVEWHGLRWPECAAKGQGGLELQLDDYL